MPVGLRGQPALQFAGPGQLRQLFLQAFRTVAGCGKTTKLKFRKAPPDHHATSATFCPAEGRGINPGAVLRRGGGLQFIQHGRLEPVGQIPWPSSLPRNSSTAWRAAMTTMTVCKSAVVCGSTWIIHTICATGSGDNFSNCNSTIASVSSKLLRGSSMTRRKTFSGGSHATFNRGCHKERHDLATRLNGNGSPARPRVRG